MTASRQDIIDWLAEASKVGATHLIVMHDQWDHENFPVYVMPGQSARAEAGKHVSNMQEVEECYSMSRDLAAQLNEHRARNFDS